MIVCEAAYIEDEKCRLPGNKRPDGQGDEMRRLGKAAALALAGIAALILLRMGGVLECAPIRAAKAVSIDLSQPEEAEMLSFSLEVLATTTAEKTVRRVFIYHTHTYEAYEMDAENRYTPTETWRTADANYNMVRVGEELAQRLREAGIEVEHDVTAYEPPRLSTAYARSLEGLQKATQKEFDLYLDLHRDSYSKGNGENTVEKGGMLLARTLILIGQGTGTGFDERPDWEQNQRVAQQIADAMNRQAAGLCRGVSLKSGRYNQQAASPSMLIEIGNNKNTLPEALATTAYLANAICAYFDGL